MKKISKIYPYIFAISFIIFVTCAVVYLVCFNRHDMLYKLILKYKTYENLPFKLEETELQLVANSLMKYLAGKTAFLDTKVHINGILTDFYSTTGKIHMGDVRFIFQTLKYTSYICIVLCIFSCFKTMQNLEKPVKYLRHAYIKTAIVYVLLIIFGLIFATINFDSFFTIFHKILFRNDYWIFDPNVDFVINLLPEKIFMVIGLRMVGLVLIILILTGLYFLLLLKTQLRQEAKRRLENDAQPEARHQDPSH